MRSAFSADDRSRFMMPVRSAGRRTGAAIALALALGPGVVFAADTVSASNAWVRATAPGQKTAAAYLELTSKSDAALVAVESPSAARAELHSMGVDGGVMKMRPVRRIELPARKTVKLAPGGLHVMLIGVKQPLKAGDKVPLMLSVESAGGVTSTITTEAEVRAAAGAAGHQHH
jgi:copper(I)-binding protein